MIILCKKKKKKKESVLYVLSSYIFIHCLKIYVNTAMQEHWERGGGAVPSLFIWAIAEASTELTFNFKGLKLQWQR